MGELHNKMTALADNIRALSGQSGTLSIDDMIAATTGVSGGDDKYKKVLYRDSTLLSYSDGATVALRNMFDSMSIQSLSMPNLLIVPVEFCLKCTELTNVDISSCTSISNYAFYKCSSLTDITMPETVTEIGENAFGYCSSITEITIPQNVTKIGDFAFQYCPKLTTINYNAQSCSLGLYIFNSSAPKILNIGANVNKFPTASTLTTVSFAEGAILVPNSAFKGLSKLTSVSLSNTITSIGNDAFRDCTGLVSITIPASVTSIGSFAFRNCLSLMGIEVDENNLNYSSDENGALFNKDKTTLIKLPEKYSSTSYVVPDSVTSMESHSIHQCENLTDITIGSGVTSFSDNIFKGNSKLKVIKMLGVVNSFVKETFYISSALTTLDIKSFEQTGDQVVPDGVFFNCSNLNTLVIREATQTQLDWIAAGCPSDSSPLVKLNSANSLANTGLTGTTAKFYVPDELVDAYKAASVWSNYADKIYPVSEYVETT